MDNIEIQPMGLDELIKAHLFPLDVDQNLKDRVFHSFKFLCGDMNLVEKSTGETFYPIPYQKITHVIYQTEFDGNSEIDSLVDVFVEDFTSFIGINNLTDRNKRLAINKSLFHQLNAYKRFVSHIQLAICQKKFIENQLIDVVIQISELKNENRDLKQNLMYSIRTISTLKRDIDLLNNELSHARKQLTDGREIVFQSVKNAQDSIDKSIIAEQTVQKVVKDVELIQLETQNALASANKAQKDAEDSKTQFVTILGIFATIIVALFGGMSLIRATVELLQNSSSLMIVVFVTALLLLSFSLLIILLTSWISSLKSEEENKRYNSFRGICIFILALVVISSGLLIHENPVKKDDKKNQKLEFELKTTASN